jgi:hypothetical protein
MTPVLGIRIRMFLALPDLLVRGMDPDPDPFLLSEMRNVLSKLKINEGRSRIH